MENNNSVNNRQGYRDSVKQMGKKEFTLIKMQEYGFWPENYPTPYERQKNETPEAYAERKALLKEYEKLAQEFSQLYQEKSQINAKLNELRKQYDQTWDAEKIRRDVAQAIMRESIARRAERKKQRELEKQKRREQWEAHKKNNIVFIGKGYSGALGDKESNLERLTALGLPIIFDDKALAAVLQVEYETLRSLVYHRDVVTQDHYYHYTVPKKNGGERKIAAPKSVLKHAQRRILELFLSPLETSSHAHGFQKGRSVITGAAVHQNQPELLINMDLENFFPTITFQRVRGLFHSFGYSGYLSSLLAMLCTYCEREEIEVKGETRYVKASDRILPQGSPASPMITNLICRAMDERIHGLAVRKGFTYSRYADDMSFSFSKLPEKQEIGKIVHAVTLIIQDEGFTVNRKKTRYLRSNNRQCVTGVLVNNEQLGVPKAWVKKMRAAVYNAGRLLESEAAVPAETIYEISGMAAWLRAVNEKRYQSIISEAQKLLENCKNT